MASTARKEDETKEFFDPPEELDRKVTQLADWIRQSRHFIVFTGAGISTSAGIPDFRSGIDTSLETGPGKWELRAKGVERNAKKHRSTTTAKAIPTPTHMSIVQLVNEGILHAVVSQNTDGLHRRSGLPTSKLYELHGNSNVEKCCKCKKEYLRDFRTRTATAVKKHKTGRKCDNPECRGDLKDTIINFGEDLPEAVLDAGFEHAEKADLCIAMGSSLTVTPAADIPETVGKKSRLVIVNLQRTPLDYVATLRINGKCDDVMKLLMSKLSQDIPEFRLNRRVLVRASKKSDKYEVSIEGKDKEDQPFSFLKSVTFTGRGPGITCDVEPYVAEMKGGIDIKINLEFHSHYGEPPMKLTLNLTSSKEVTADLQYNPFTRTWTVSRSDKYIDEDITGHANPKPPGHPSPKATGQPSAKAAGQPNPKPSGRPNPKATGQPSAKAAGQPNPKPSGRPNPKPSGRPNPKPGLTDTGTRAVKGELGAAKDVLDQMQALYIEKGGT